MVRRLAIWAGVLLLTALPAAAQDRETKVRNDRKELEANSKWIYNDLDQGLRIAKNEGKPLLVVLRCIP